MDELVERMSVGVGDRGPGVHAAGHRAGVQDYSLADFAGQAGRARLLPGRRHAGVHEAAQRLQRRARVSSTSSTPRCSASRPRTSTATSGSRRKHGFKFPLLADTDKAVARPYGTLGPIGFPRRSVFIVDGDGTIRYAHRAIAGLTYRPVSELVAVLERALTASVRSVPARSGDRSTRGGVARGRLPYEPVFVSRVDDASVLGIDPGLTRCGYAVVDGGAAGRRHGRRPRRDPHARRAIRCRSGWRRCAASWRR